MARSLLLGALAAALCLIGAAAMLYEVPLDAATVCRAALADEGIAASSSPTQRHFPLRINLTTAPQPHYVALCITDAGGLVSYGFLDAGELLPRLDVWVSGPEAFVVLVQEPGTNRWSDDLEPCSSMAQVHVREEYVDQRNWGFLSSQECLAVPADFQPAPYGDPSARVPWNGWWWVAMVLVGSSMAAIAVPRAAAWGMALFSRIAGQEAADHPVRRRVIELVQADPGIHLNELQRVALLGSGQTRYHVEVLVRCKILGRTRIGNREHLFPAFLGDQARRRMALLRHPAARRIKDALEPGAPMTLGALATEARLSLPSTSRWVSRMCAVGLAMKSREGQRTLVGLR
jgi:hypothetical protein